MTESHKRFQGVFDELFTFSKQNKILFLESLLFHFTISGRGIWSDEQSSDQEKAEAFRWMNELNHRIWNIRHELKQGIDSDSTIRLYETLRFYGEKSTALRVHIVPTIISTFDLFKASMTT